MSISHISGPSNTLYAQLSSGNRLTSAAVDPAGMTQSQNMEAQQRTQKAAANNVASAQDAARIQDGAMGNISDSLQRMRELGVQAQNDLLSDDDKKAIQDEVNQLAQGIADVAKNTSYNTKPLLNEDGTMQISTGNGETELSTTDATLSGLGLTNLDVTSTDFLGDLDSVMENLNDSRTSNGAQSNGYEYAYNNLANSNVNTVAGLSRKADMDMAEGITEMKRKQALQQYQLTMQNKKMENQGNQMRAMFS